MEFAYSIMLKLLLAAIIFIPAEKLLPTRREQKIIRREFGNDLFYASVGGMLAFGGLIATLGVGVALVTPVMPLAITSAIGGLPFWAELPLAIVIADLAYYWAHRLFHTNRSLWRIHMVHHSIEELDWLATHRVHPIEAVITRGAALLPLLTLGFEPSTIGAFAIIYQWHSLFIHSNIRCDFGPLKWLIASPEFHHWHHANEPEATNKNFTAQLPIIDLVFGSLYLPQGRTPSKFGVNEAVPVTYLQQLAFPFRRHQRDCGEGLTGDLPAGAP